MSHIYVLRINQPNYHKDQPLKFGQKFLPMHINRLHGARTTKITKILVVLAWCKQYFIPVYFCRQILKCMWCGQSFRSLAELTTHMSETKHYTKVIPQEQLSTWRAQQQQNSPSHSSTPSPALSTQPSPTSIVSPFFQAYPSFLNRSLKTEFGHYE